MRHTQQFIYLIVYFDNWNETILKKLFLNPKVKNDNHLDFKTHFENELFFP